MALIPSRAIARPLATQLLVPARALLLLILLTGCVQTNATLLNPSPVLRPKVPPHLVRIYRTPDQVQGKYEEVALLNSTGESNWTNESGMLESMRRKAGDLGANAIILDAINEAGAGAKVAAAIFGTGTQRKGRSIAIFVFPDSAAREQEGGWLLHSGQLARDRPRRIEKLQARRA